MDNKITGGVQLINPLIYEQTIDIMNPLICEQTTDLMNH